MTEQEITIMQRILNNLPDTERLNGSIRATAIRGLLRPILIIEDMPKNNHSLNMAIDYYAPAAAAKMGLPVERTLFITKEEGVHDPIYTIVDLPKLIIDPWGRAHAGGGNIVWREMPRVFYEKLMGVLDQKPSVMIGKKWVFVLPDNTLQIETIAGYDGKYYYNESGQKIVGKISRQ